MMKNKQLEHALIAVMVAGTVSGAVAVSSISSAQDAGMQKMPMYQEGQSGGQNTFMPQGRMNGGQGMMQPGMKPVDMQFGGQNMGQQGGTNTQKGSMMQPNMPFGGQMQGGQGMMKPMNQGGTNGQTGGMNFMKGNLMQEPMNTRGGQQMHGASDTESPKDMMKQPGMNGMQNMMGGQNMGGQQEMQGDMGFGNTKGSMPKMNLPPIDDLETEEVEIDEKTVKIIVNAVTKSAKAIDAQVKAWAKLEAKLEDGVSKAEMKSLMTFGRKAQKAGADAEMLESRISAYCELDNESVTAACDTLTEKMEEILGALEGASAYVEQR